MYERDAGATHIWLAGNSGPAESVLREEDAASGTNRWIGVLAVALRFGLVLSAQSLGVPQTFMVQLHGQKTTEGEPVTRRGRGCLLL